MKVKIDRPATGILAFYQGNVLIEQFEHEFVYMGGWKSSEREVTFYPQYATDTVRMIKPDGTEVWIKVAALPGDSLTLRFHTDLE